MFGRPSIKISRLHHIGNVDGAFALDNLTLGILLALAHMPLDHPRAFDDDTLLLGVDANDSAALAFIGAGDDNDFVVLLDVATVHKSREKELNDFRGERNDLHELLVAQFASHGTENTSAARVQFLINDNNGVAVEAKIRTVAAMNGLAGAHDDGIHDFALFHSAIRSGFFDVRFDDVANPGVALVSAENANGSGALGAGVIGHVEDRANLEHES